MITMEQYMDIKTLKQEGISIREISRKTGHSRNTVRKVLRGLHDMKIKPYERNSKLDPFKDYIKGRFEKYQLNAVRLYDEVKKMGYKSSIATVRRYLKTLKSDTIRLGKITVRFETPPGKQAQADWAYCGKFDHPSGRKIPVYLFVMVLSFSRMLFIRFTNSMKMCYLLECHQKAFEFFGGVTQTILYDNMKQVRIGVNKLNEAFLDFANHYGFTPKTHKPYRPRTKGKVERAVDYVEESFLAGRQFNGLDDLNAQALHWLANTANVRIHGTTGQKPVDLFEFDRKELIDVSGIAAYHYLDPVRRTVNFESMVNYQSSRYSVPPEHAGKTVEVASDGGHILVRVGDIIIAEHRQATGPGQCIVNKDHIADLWKLTLQRVKPPSEARRFDIDFTQTVEQMPLTIFEDLSAVSAQAEVAV